jgi:hypothetical protein
MRNNPLRLYRRDRSKSDASVGLQLVRMGNYSLEISEYLYSLKCDCCGGKKNRVWGFVSDNGDARAVYYALLNIEEESPRVGLTLSVGPWGEGTEPSRRVWVQLNVWPDENGIRMGIREPRESNFYPWEMGGVPLTRDQAKLNAAVDEIWSVADFVVDADRAVSSYLEGQTVDATDREIRDLDQPLHSC